VRYVAEQNRLPRAGDTVGIELSTGQAFPRQPGEQHSFNPVWIQPGRSRGIQGYALQMRADSCKQPTIVDAAAANQDICGLKRQDGVCNCYG
jgi:hypothetical protein